MFQRYFGVAVACFALLAVGHTARANVVSTEPEPQPVYLASGQANIALVYEGEFSNDGDQAVAAAVVVESGATVFMDGRWQVLKETTFLRPDEVQIVVPDNSTELPSEVTKDLGLADNTTAATITTDGPFTVGFSVEYLMNPTFTPDDPPLGTNDQFTFLAQTSTSGTGTSPSLIGWTGTDGETQGDANQEPTQLVFVDTDSTKNNSIKLNTASELLQQNINWSFLLDPKNQSTVESTFFIDFQVEFASGETPAGFFPETTYSFAVGGLPEGIPDIPSLVIPEPNTAALAGLLLGAWGCSRRRRTS